MKYFAKIALFFFAVTSMSVQAGITLNSTRFIYKSNEKDVSVRLSNDGENPALAQIWLDDGDASLSPSKIEVPFVLSSPMLRIEPKQVHVVRIIGTTASLPQDRETMFWLNILDVPAKPKDADSQNFLQFAIRTRVKFIYRPAALASSVSAAFKAMTLEVVETFPLKLRLRNSSAYFLNFGNILLKRDGKQLGTGMFAMVKPFDYLDLEFDYDGNKGKDGNPDEVSFSLIDDFGAAAVQVIPLNIVNSRR